MRIREIRVPGQRPPPLIFLKAQATERLSAPLFYLDGFLHNSLSNDRELCRKLFVLGSCFCKKKCFLSETDKISKFISFSVEKWYAARAPPVSDICQPQMSETEESMYKRYFRMKDPRRGPEEIEWIEMTGSEFYRFINSPEGQGRYFIDMGDVVLEASKREAQVHRAEKDHSDYLKEQAEGWNTLSIYAIEDEYGCSGEEVAKDETQDVEAEAMTRMETVALRKALERLDSESYQLIHALYLADTRKTLRQLSLDSGIPVMTLQDRKKKILTSLRRNMFRKNF